MRYGLLISLGLIATVAVAPPTDTVDWERHDPLAVGNTWEYRDAHADGDPFRHTLGSSRRRGCRSLRCQLHSCGPVRLSGTLSCAPQR